MTASRQSLMSHRQEPEMTGAPPNKSPNETVVFGVKKEFP